MDVMDTPHPLVANWHREADGYERRGQTNLAAMVRSLADDLASYEVVAGLQELTLAEASAESGFSSGHLSRALTEGRIENVGEKGHPRIRRKDLPRKIAPPPEDGVDLAGAVKRAQNGGSTQVS